MIQLSKIIGPAYYDTHLDLMNWNHTYYDLYGGRGSLKSSFISLEIVYGIVKNPGVSAAIFRKVGDTLRNSVYAQIGWAISALGLDRYFKSQKSPLMYIYIPTGQVITFHGLDKAEKQKSVKCPDPKGYYGYLWFEELAEYTGPEEIRSVQQSYRRGGKRFVVFKSFNPPRSKSNWCNEYVQTPDNRAYRKLTTYLQAPADWLGEAFIEDAEHLKAVNLKAYNHEYLGEAIGMGTDIFDNIEIRTITDDEINSYERFYQGQDWGWNPDPKAWIRCSYNKQQDTIYLCDEIVGTKIPIEKMVEQINAKNYPREAIICGADEQESIAKYVSLGLNARRVNNKPGSVNYQMEWLQSRKIVIDPNRTPEAYHEIINYNFDVDKRGNVIPVYPDRDNHCIDALRYSLSEIAAMKQIKVLNKPKYF